MDKDKRIESLNRELKHTAKQRAQLEQSNAALREQLRVQALENERLKTTQRQAWDAALELNSQISAQEAINDHHLGFE